MSWTLAVSAVETDVNQILTQRSSYRDSCDKVSKDRCGEEGFVTVSFI